MQIYYFCTCSANASFSASSFDKPSQYCKIAALSSYKSWLNMKTTYTKVDGKVFSIYSDKLSDIEALLMDANIQHIECFFVTQREKTMLCKLF